MTLTHQQLQKIDDISECICKFFNIKEQDLISQKRKEPICNARFFLWHILHYKLGLSSNKISNIYFKHIRSVWRGISKVENGIKRQAYYKNIYEDLYKIVEPLIPKDIERFLEGSGRANFNDN